MALFPSNPSAPSQLPNGNVIHHPLSPFPSFSLSRSGWISLPWLVEQMQISWTNADKATASPLSFNQCSDPQAYTDTHTHTHATYIQFACPHMSPACEQLAFFPCTSDISALDVACSVSNDQVLCGNKGSSEPSVCFSHVFRRSWFLKDNFGL